MLIIWYKEIYCLFLHCKCFILVICFSYFSYKCFRLILFEPRLVKAVGSSFGGVAQW